MPKLAETKTRSVAVLGPAVAAKKILSRPQAGRPRAEDPVASQPSRPREEILSRQLAASRVSNLTRQDFWRKIQAPGILARALEPWGYWKPEKGIVEGIVDIGGDRGRDRGYEYVSQLVWAALGWAGLGWAQHLGPFFSEKPHVGGDPLWRPCIVRGFLQR